MNLRGIIIAVAVLVTISTIAIIFLTNENEIGIIQGKTNQPWYHKCDLNCKTNWEKKGLTCFTEPDGNFLCKSASRFTVDNVIPWGSEKMPYQRNFVYDVLKLSLEINNTVSWFNADDFPHRIVSDDGVFDSGIILPNQTWYHVFNKTGLYLYHGEHPWLKGNVTVQPLDPNYFPLGNQPIWKNTNDPSIHYLIFRETDHWGYIKKVSVLDEKTISISLSDFQSTNSTDILQKTLKIGDSIVGSCGKSLNGDIRISYLTLTRIVNTGITPFAEFREDPTSPSSSPSCLLHDLF